MTKTKDAILEKIGKCEFRIKTKENGKTSEYFNEFCWVNPDSTPEKIIIALSLNKDYQGTLTFTKQDKLYKVEESGNIFGYVLHNSIFVYKNVSLDEIIEELQNFKNTRLNNVYTFNTLKNIGFTDRNVEMEILHR